MLTYLDFFGIDYAFMHSGKQKLQTKPGAIITILFLIICIALFFMFGVELFQRTQPFSYFNTELKEYYDHNLANDIFTFAYRVEDRNGLIYTNDKI
jgi:hypothetical protein